MLVCCSLLILAASLQELNPGGGAVEEKVLYVVPDEITVDEGGVLAWVSPDLSRCVVEVTANDAVTMILDGEVIGQADWAYDPAFGEKGTVAWTWGWTAEDGEESASIWKDGKEYQDSDWIGPVHFDGDTPYYCAVDKMEKQADGSYGGGEFRFFRGKKGSRERYIGIQDYRRTPTLLGGGKLAYIAKLEDGYRVCVAKDEFGPYTWAAYFTVAADGKRVAWTTFLQAGGPDPREALAEYQVNPGEGEYRIRTFGGKGDQKREPTVHDGGYDYVTTPALGGPSGEQLAYLAMKDHRLMYVVKDGVELAGAWASVGTPVFSPDGVRLAYTVCHAAGDLDAYPERMMPDWLDGLTDWDPAIKPIGTCSLVIDGEVKSAKFKCAIGPTWSPDGESVAFRAQTAEGWSVVCGDAVSPVYTRVGALRFQPDGRIGFVAIAGREVRWVTFDPTRARD